jgi:type IV pilus assembly protein PilM
VAIGLDIGSSAVRAAELETRRGHRVRLTRYGQVPLPPGAVVDGDVMDPAVVADRLRELWSATGLRPRNVAVGLASQKVTVRQIELPHLPEAEIAEAVRLQAQDQLPIAADEALLDYVMMVDPPADVEQRKLRLLLVAAEREMVERLLFAVTAAKLRPVLVDLDAFALLRSVGTSAVMTDGAELIVDVGANVTKIAVHHGGRPLFVRMVRLGGDAVTRQLQKALDLSWEEAEGAKIDASESVAAGADLDPEDERPRVLQEGVRRVVTEVRHSLEFFRSQHDVQVERLILSGGGSLAPNLRERLHGDLDLPVDQADPLRAMEPTNSSGRPLVQPGQIPFLAVPVGLALGLLR